MLYDVTQDFVDVIFFIFVELILLLDMALSLIMDFCIMQGTRGDFPNYLTEFAGGQRGLPGPPVSHILSVILWMQSPIFRSDHSDPHLLYNPVCPASMIHLPVF